MNQENIQIITTSMDPRAASEDETMINTSNSKRIDSCRAVGGIKKRNGHEKEKIFMQKYNPNCTELEYGPKADTSIDPSHPICEILKKELNINGLNVSNKSGQTIQCTLGRIPELENINIEDLTKESTKRIFDIYLKKNKSDKPANILAYADEVNNQHIFFNMDHVIEFISENCIWRKLNSGRIKGDFHDNSRKRKRQYITYEYRPRHKSYFLGMNGKGKGKLFIELLMNNIKFYCDKI